METRIFKTENIQGMCCCYKGQIWSQTQMRNED
ncbi:hypothetical protein POPTR_010G095050v4 [Populus trichocarpa]|uniref:Uncharacterized protein n=1 Tax=Populus trichocarpa TaxID=3694 RepID=A0ACC0SCE7_POPTR|nr:hypothetical protein BDE02_10G083300 [Populus trichocarpa]KAI9386927.1 hypothetical protein POPTR_010G095050v4 [Populus trichocarpa]